MKFIYIKDYLQGEKNSRKSNQRNKCRKNIIGFKKLKIKIIKKRKEKKGEKKENTELQKPTIEAEVFNKNRKCD